MSETVLHLSAYFPPHNFGGYGATAEDNCLVLRQWRGTRNVVLTSDFRKSGSAVESGVADRVERSLGLVMPPLAGDYAVDPDNARRNCSRLAEFVATLRPELVIVYNTDPVGNELLQVLTAMRRRVIFYEMGYEHVRHYARIKSDLRASLGSRALHSPRALYANARAYLRHRRLLAGASAVYCSGHLQAFYRRNGVTHRHAAVIYPGLDLERYRRKQRYVPDGNRFRAVYAGVVAPNKGADEMLDAASKVNAHTGHRLHVDIFGDVYKRYRRRAELEASPYFTVHGFVARSELAERLADYDLALFPSTWDEPFGISRIEFMAAGLPTVSSRCGAGAETITHGRDGLIVDPLDAAHLETTLTSLLDDYQSLAPSLGGGAAHTASQRFTRETYAQQFCALLERARS